MGNALVANDIYNQEFFDMHLEWRADYHQLALALNHLLDFDHVADLGCGNGYMVDTLRRLGKSYLAVDYAEAASGYSDLYIYNCDLRNQLDFFRRFDLVTCLEVAEHIEEHYAYALIGNIVRHALKWIVFSAADPGSGGVNHVNEQPRIYWETKFREYGIKMDRNRTFQLKWELRHNCINTSWFARNIMVLRCPQ